MKATQTTATTQELETPIALTNLCETNVCEQGRHTSSEKRLVTHVVCAILYKPHCQRRNIQGASPISGAAVDVKDFPYLTEA